MTWRWNRRLHCLCAQRPDRPSIVTDKSRYDKGAPDYQTGVKKDLKWRVICAGVEALMKAKGLHEEDIMLWADWQPVWLKPMTRRVDPCSCVPTIAATLQAVCPPGHLTSYILHLTSYD